MKALFPYAATTAGVTVRVAPRYLDEQSDPDAGAWAWSYHIRIENGTDDDVQLLARHWIITDARGRVEQVRGPGVVGEQPVIAPGEAFDYVSGCPLPTPSGTMVGTYTMATRERLFEVAIPLFSLDTPDARRVVN
ncbi:MAG: Co2+/Mg2+ efflux protein ApaG [Sphingomonadaceae bacterium]|nr:Co2+/Mg2+ efflux protein ApaG [Sphingomonadaceae bacterium]